MRRTEKQKHKARRLAILSLLSTAVMSACGVNPPSTPGDSLIPIRDHLTCLPKDTAMISAHRGTSRDWAEPENSQSALKKLITKKYLMAEIDVARLKDGTHIAYHDGVWEEASTGRGPVAASEKNDLEKILLKTRKGELSADRPPLLQDLLIAAKNELYLEIDFKSSANMGQVVNMIRDAKMSDQVILISYSNGQARRLAELAPEMMLSLPPSSNQEGHAAWVGKDIHHTRYKDRDFLIGKLGPAQFEKEANAKRENAAILVTDYANQYRPITGLTRSSAKTYKTCLDKVAHIEASD